MTFGSKAWIKSKTDKRIFEINDDELEKLIYVIRFF